MQSSCSARNQGGCSTSSGVAPVSHGSVVRGMAAHRHSCNARRLLRLLAGATGVTQRSVAVAATAKAVHSSQVATSGTPSSSSNSSSSKQEWDYKYPHNRSISSCRHRDQLCCKVEALFQNVLSFPKLPNRVVAALPYLTQSLEGITALVEQMAAHYGKELAFIFLKTDPAILNMDFAAVLQHQEQAQQVLGMAAQDMPLLLKKNPSLLCMPLEVMRQRYEALPRVCRLPPQQAALLAIKYPSVLNLRSEAVAGRVDRLAHVAGAREQWLADLEGITPSLLAFFLKDATDLLLRLEYLASTGERPDLNLRKVFKLTNATFAIKFKHFTKWRNMVVERRKAQGAAQQAAQMSAEAVALQASVSGQAGASGSSGSRRRA